MKFIQTVYYNDKPIIITDNAAEYAEQHGIARDFPLFQTLTPENFASAVEEVKNEDIAGVLINEPDHASLELHLGNNFKIVKAGGGLVMNDEGNLLLMFRRGKWDLPKGKLDKGETIAECALREVREETGIRQLTLGDLLAETWHLYNEKNKNLVKHTTWYHMTSTDRQKLIPQQEEDIMEVRWVNPAELLPYVANTYQAIKDVLKHAGHSW